MLNSDNKYKFNICSDITDNKNYNDSNDDTYDTYDTYNTFYNDNTYDNTYYDTYDDTYNTNYNNKDIFMVMNNDIPFCYTETKEEAIECMWKLARQSKITYNDYNTYIIEKEPNRICLTGYYKFYAISYSRTLEKFEIFHIKKLYKKMFFFV